MRASHHCFLNEGPTPIIDTCGSPFPWFGDGAGGGGAGGRWGRWLRLWLSNLCVFNSLFPGIGLLPVGAQRGAREPDSPWGSSPTQSRAPRTYRNLVCWSLCAPVICLYTSFSCQAREGNETGALGEPLPRAIQAQRTPQGWLGAYPWACPWPRPLQETFTGNRSQDGSMPGTCPRMHLFPTRKTQVPQLLSHPPVSHPCPEMPVAWGTASLALTFSSTSWRSWSHSRVSGFSRFSVQRRARRRDSP